VFSKSKISNSQCLLLYIFFFKSEVLQYFSVVSFITWFSKSFQGLLSALLSLVFYLLRSNLLALPWPAFFLMFQAKSKDRYLFYSFVGEVVVPPTLCTRLPFFNLRIKEQPPKKLSLFGVNLQ